LTKPTTRDPLSGVLDDATYDSDAAATAGGVSFASPNLTWTGDLAVGASATVTFSVTVTDPDTGNKILASTITSVTPGSNCAAGSGDPPCTSAVNVAVLTITDSSSVSTTTPGSVVRFTAVFTNAGQTPYTGITIATDITDVLDDATPDGDQTATSGTLTLTATGISWTGNIPVGGTVSVTGTVTVNNPDTGNKVMASTLSTAGSVSYASPVLTWAGSLAPGGTATVTVNDPDTGDKILVADAISTAAVSSCPPASGNPGCNLAVPVLTPALTITQDASPATATPGQQVSYTITVTDSGQTSYTGATVTDPLSAVLDDAVYDHDAAATTGTVTSPDLTWTGDLNPGDSATITFTVTVNNPDTGDKQLVNVVTSAATVTVLIPALTITKTATTTTTTPGSAVGYTVTVTDTGPTPYTAATITDDLDGVLDDAAYDHDAAATSGTVSYASPVLTWTGDLAPGDSATITYSVTVNNPDTGTGALSNTVVSTVPGSTCPAGSGDPGCNVTIAVVAGPLSITGSATFTPVPEVQLSATPQPVVTAANVAGNTTVTWDPTIDVTIPGGAIAGTYTATITHSVS
jgi:large repetitive protein